MHRPHRQPRAFTLLELLAVIGIISLIIAILVPSLAGARRTAAATACLSNLRQWSAAVVMYAQANEGCLPRRGQGIQITTLINRPEDWFNALPPLMGLPTYNDNFARSQVPRAGDKSLAVCPAADATTNINFFSYAMNMRLSTWQSPDPDRIDRVAPTDRQVFLADAPGDYCSILPAAQPYSAIARHNKTINIAFLDGHAAGFSGDYVGCGTGDPQRGDVRWLVPNSPWPGPSP